MTNNQKIFFDIPNEDITAQDLISDILENNGVTGITEDLLSSKGTPKLTLVFNAIKDFSDEKISEENILKLLQEKLNIKEGNATGIIKDAKEKILPFAKKNGVATTIAPPPPIPTRPSKIKKPIFDSKTLTETKKVTRTGPDNYREPIE